MNEFYILQIYIDMLLPRKGVFDRNSLIINYLQYIRFQKPKHIACKM